jgi:hypothetical protein
MPDTPALQDTFGQSTEQRPGFGFPMVNLLRLFHTGAGVPLGALIVTLVHPHRVEPRVKKRRPKSFPLIMKPRQALRQQLVQQELQG